MTRLTSQICLCCLLRVGDTHLLERLPDGRLLLWCYADPAGVARATDVTEAES